MSPCSPRRIPPLAIGLANSLASSDAVWGGAAGVRRLEFGADGVERRVELRQCGHGRAREAAQPAATVLQDTPPVKVRFWTVLPKNEYIIEDTLKIRRPGTSRRQ